MNSRICVFCTVAFLAALLLGCRTTAVIEQEVPPADTTAVVIDAPVEDEDDQTYTVMDMGLDDFEPRIRIYNIHHTSLDLRFDFPREVINGTATHTLTPLSPGLDSLYFDAADMDIHHVILRHGDGFADTLQFRYEGHALTALTIEALSPADTVDVEIEYSAHPNRSEAVLGLHFVDGPGIDPSNPTQVWTLSQPEDGRYWFPQWDYPNDFMTFDIAMTVPQNKKALANGVLAESENVGGGLRRDVWLLDQPHVSYLTAIAVGEFAIVPDTLHRADGTYLPLQYIVEPQYAEHAHLVFGETPRMIEVMEQRTGVRYPWPNYRQVAVREFTAGGMEHTTLSTMTSTLQHDPRAHLDYTGRDLIAHEAIHQWFGNLVTNKDWAHLSINEGFASYFEEVYLEDAHGMEMAQEHAIDDLNTYLAEARQYRRPIVWYGYDDPYQQYDRHTYQKAARVLNQMRFELGEDAWWRGINRFLVNFRHRNVDARDLQRTMEDASGRDLERFFQQWWYSPGHPEVLVQHQFDASRGLYSLRVQQTHDTTEVPVFHFDVDFVVHYAQRDPYVERVSVTSADTTFRVGTAGEIAFVRFDHGNELLADITEEKPLIQWTAQATLSDEMAARYHAVRYLGEAEEREVAVDALLRALSDSYDYVRMHAAQGLAGDIGIDRVRRALLGAASGDASSRVRNAALQAMREAEVDAQHQAVLRDALRDSSYVVTATAVGEYARRFPDRAMNEFQHLIGLDTWQSTVERALVGAVAPLEDTRAFDYVLSRTAAERPAIERAAAMRALPQAVGADLERHDRASQVLHRALEDVSVSVRAAAIASLASEQITVDRSVVAARLNAETHSRVAEQLRALLDGAEETLP